jgi:hypothetical protein
MTEAIMTFNRLVNELTPRKAMILYNATRLVSFYFSVSLCQVIMRSVILLILKMPSVILLSFNMSIVILLSFNMPSVILPCDTMLSANMSSCLLLNDIRPIVISLSIIRPNVVAPQHQQWWEQMLPRPLSSLNFRPKKVSLKRKIFFFLKISPA